MSEKKPTSLFPQRTVRKCPVCQETTYSSSGIHPQCAVKQADEPRRQKLAAEKKTKKDSVENARKSEASGSQE